MKAYCVQVHKQDTTHQLAQLSPNLKLQKWWIDINNNIWILPRLIIIVEFRKIEKKV